MIKNSYFPQRTSRQYPTSQYKTIYSSFKPEFPIDKQLCSHKRGLKLFVFCGVSGHTNKILRSALVKKTTKMKKFNQAK